MIKRLWKQKQIGKATFHFSFLFSRSSKAKPRTVTFCSCKSFACPPESFLPCSRCPVVQHPARPSEKQSRASIIETSKIRRTKTWTFSGASANAGPHYQKLYARVTHIWGNRKGQPDPSAMKGPRLERTASLITVPPASGKFFMFWANEQPPSRVSAMALRHNVQSPLRQRRAMPQEGVHQQNGGSTRTPTSLRDRTSPPQIKANKKQKSLKNCQKARNRTLRTPA